MDLIKNRTKYLFVLIVAAVCLKQYGSTLTEAEPVIKKFFKAHGNYARLRNTSPTFASTTRAKELIPPGSAVAISYLPSSIENIAARYNLYPLELSPHWDYLIDLAHSVKDPLSTPLNNRQLSTGIFLFSKDNLPFLSPPKTSGRNASGKSLLLFTVLVIFETLLGLSLLNLFKIPFPKTDVLWITTTGYLAGFCVFTASLWLLLLGGVPLNLQTLILLALFLSTLSLFSFSKPWPKAAPPPFVRDKKTFMEKIFFTLAIFLISVVILWIIGSPVKDWDTMTNWIIKSKVMFHKQNLDLAYTYHHHNSYPILWPLHVAATFTALGGDYDEAAVWSSALFFCMFLVQLSKGFSISGVKPIFVYLSLLLYLAFFVSENPTTAALPENAFLCFLTALTVTFCLWIESPQKKGYLALNIILATGLNLLKLEGAVTTAVLIFSLIIVTRKDVLAKSAWPWLGIFLLTALPPVLWVQWTKAHGLSGGIYHLTQKFSYDKLFFLGQLHARHFFQKGEFLILLFAVGYCVLFPNPRKWTASERFLLIIFVLLMAFKWTAMLGWNKEMLSAPGVYPDGAWRLFLHTGPALTLLFSQRAFHRI
jgi:hypothetical protein